MLAALNTWIIPSQAAELRVFVNPTPGIIDVDASGRVIPGRGTAVLDEMARGADLRFEIVPASTPRGMHEVRQSISSCMSGLSKTKERESQFSWVGPLTRTQVLVYVRAEHGSIGVSAPDLRGKTVAALTASVPAQKLQEQGISVMGVAHLETGLRMLVAGRVDYLASSEAAIASLGAGTLAQGIKPIAGLGDIEYFLACNANTPVELLQRLRNSVEGMRSRGTLRPYGVF